MSNFNNRIIFILFVIFFASFILLKLQSIELTKEANTLFYIDENNEKNLVAEIEQGLFFLGFSIIDSTSFFVAHEELGDDALCSLNIYHLNKGRENIIILPFSGESYFRYNSTNDMVIFQWDNGIYYLRLHNKDGELIIDRTINDINLLIQGLNIYEPIWIDESTLEYKELINDRLVKKYYNLESIIEED